MKKRIDWPRLAWRGIGYALLSITTMLFAWACVRHRWNAATTLMLFSQLLLIGLSR
jgi:hypothetical protein